MTAGLNLMYLLWGANGSLEALRNHPTVYYVALDACPVQIQFVVFLISQWVEPWLDAAVSLLRMSLLLQLKLQ